MTPLDYLRSQGTATAQEIAAALRISREAVYLNLVRAEAEGRARVVVESYGHQTPTRYWQAW